MKIIFTLKILYDNKTLTTEQEYILIYLKLLFEIYCYILRVTQIYHYHYIYQNKRMFDFRLTQSSEMKMIKVFTYSERMKNYNSYENMVKARAHVFHERLNWEVEVINGREEDEYDRLYNPLYIISERSDGSHAASIRLLPTTGPTMLRNIFYRFFPDCPDIYGANIWEVTRYCATLNKGDSMEHTGELFIKLADLCLDAGIDIVTGVFFKPMFRILTRSGWDPVPVSISEHAGKSIILGTFEISEARKQEVAYKYQIAC